MKFQKGGVHAVGRYFEKLSLPRIMHTGPYPYYVWGENMNFPIRPIQKGDDYDSKEWKQIRIDNKLAFSKFTLDLSEIRSIILLKTNSIWSHVPISTLDS